MAKASDMDSRSDNLSADDKSELLDDSAQLGLHLYRFDPYCEVVEETGQPSAPAMNDVCMYVCIFIY